MGFTKKYNPTKVGTAPYMVSGDDCGTELFIPGGSFYTTGLIGNINADRPGFEPVLGNDVVISLVERIGGTTRPYFGSPYEFSLHGEHGRYQGLPGKEPGMVKFRNVSPGTYKLYKDGAELIEWGGTDGKYIGWGFPYAEAEVTREPTHECVYCGTQYLGNPLKACESCGNGSREYRRL